MPLRFKNDALTFAQGPLDWAEYVIESDTVGISVSETDSVTTIAITDKTDSDILTITLTEAYKKTAKETDGLTIALLEADTLQIQLHDDDTMELTLIEDDSGLQKIYRSGNIVRQRITGKFTRR